MSDYVPIYNVPTGSMLLNAAAEVDWMLDNLPHGQSGSRRVEDAVYDLLVETSDGLESGWTGGKTLHLLSTYNLMQSRLAELLFEWQYIGYLLYIIERNAGG